VPTVRTAALAAAALSAALACSAHAQPCAAELVVDTVGIIAQPYIAVSEAVGIPNYGGTHIIERIRLRDADTLAVELAITAPEVLRNGDAGGIFLEASLADGSVMTYSTELPTE
jgi:hypothetical protein